MEEERLNEEEAKKQMLNDKDCEIGSNKGDKIDKLKACEMGMEHESLGYPNQRVPTIYTEAKKHLSEMLSNGDETESLDQSDSFPESSDEVELLSVSADPKQQQQQEDPKFKSQKNLPDSFPESSDEIELLRVSDDSNPKQQEEEEGEEDPKFELQKKLSDSFPESLDELEILSVSVDPNSKQEEEEGEEDPKFELPKKLSDSFPESLDELGILSVSVDPNSKQEEEEYPKFKLLKKLPDSIFQKKLMELLDNTFFCL